MLKTIQLLCVGFLLVAHMALAVPAGAVNVNNADAKQLAEVLTGVGLARAEAIVAYREANGEFGSLEELLAVRGIGEHVLDSNREKIALHD